MTGLGGRADALLGAPSRRTLALSVVLLTLAWAEVHVRLLPYLVEDSYIHLRVAEHLAEFGRPHFNPGEAVKTSSSTPWTLLLSVLSLLSPRDLLMKASCASVIGVAGVVLFVALLRAVAGRELSRWEVLLSALLYLAVIASADLALMETPLALLLALAGLLAFRARKPACFAALVWACATRPELVVLLAAVAALSLATRALPLKPSLFFAAVAALPLVAFDLWAYETLIPHAAIAKRVLHTFTFTQSFAQWLPDAVVRELPWSGLLALGVGVAFFALATLPVMALGWSWRRLCEPDRQVLLVCSFTGLVIAGSYLVSGSLIFPWYRPLYFLFLLTPALIAAARSGHARSYAAPLLLALPLLFDLAGALRAAAGEPLRFRAFLEGARAQNTLALARSLYRAFPDAVLLTSEIGALGYGFRGKVVDAVGIASPASLAYHPLPAPEERLDPGDAPVPRRLVRDLAPGLIVAVDRHLTATLRDPVSLDYIHVRKALYGDDDEKRRFSEDLLWDSVRSLDVMIRRELWDRRYPPVEPR